MAGIMTAPKVVLELLLMRSMYDNPKAECRYHGCERPLMSGLLSVHSQSKLPSAIRNFCNP
jgi:hypothetical protein